MRKVSEHGQDVYLEFIRQKAELEYVASFLILVLMLIYSVLPANYIHIFFLQSPAPVQIASNPFALRLSSHPARPVLQIRPNFGIASGYYQQY